jgi:hypothetical protein
MKKVYLIAAIIGTVIPCIFFFNFIQQNGINFPLFINELFANNAAGGFAADLLISSFVFWIFMFQQQKRAHGPKPWLFIALNLGIGLSCALPAYMYVREHNDS